MGNTQDIKIKGNNSIKYNNNVMDNEDTDIILKTFKEKDNESANVAVFSLKYHSFQTAKQM